MFIVWYIQYSWWQKYTSYWLLWDTISYWMCYHGQTSKLQSDTLLHYIYKYRTKSHLSIWYFHVTRYLVLVFFSKSDWCTTFLRGPCDALMLSAKERREYHFARNHRNWTSTLEKQNKLAKNSWKLTFQLFFFTKHVFPSVSKQQYGPVNGPITGTTLTQKPEFERKALLYPLVMGKDNSMSCYDNIEKYT